MRLHIDQPLEIDDARDAARAMAVQRREAENNLEAATIKAAETERDYRQRLAQEFVKLAGTGTAAERESQARSNASTASYERDLAHGMVKVCQERLRGLEGERAMLNAVTQWSMRMYDREIPAVVQTYGDKRAA